MNSIPKLKEKQFIENGDQQLYTLYKLLVTEDDGDANLQLLKFFTDDKENLDQVDYFNMESFSGILYHYGLDGKNTKIAVYEDGEVISEFEGKGHGATNEQSKAPVTYCEDCPEGGYVLVITEHYTDYYVSWNGGDFTYSYSVYTGTTSEWVWVSGTGGYGGGGSINPTSHSHYDYPHGPSAGTNNHPNENITDEDEIEQYYIDNPNAIIVESPDTPIADLSEYLSCFDSTQNAIFTIYADQPTTNSTDPIGADGVGHAFISIQQGENVASFGFYPNGGIGYFSNASGIMGNDSNHEYDVSLSVNVNATVLQEIINYSINFANTVTYNLQTNNCTNFGIYAANLAGLPISVSSSSGSWLIGYGPNPGALGEYIRTLNLPNGTSRNNIGGTSPSNNCN